MAVIGRLLTSAGTVTSVGRSYDNSAQAINYGHYPWSSAAAASSANNYPTSYDRQDELYMNLVASQHNAYLIPTYDINHQILEIESHLPPLSSSLEDRQSTELASQSPDRTINVGESSTIMGAITLLGFLNLLGYIQSVLAGVGRRRRRSAVDGPDDVPQFIPVPPVPNIFQEIMSGLSLWAGKNTEKERLFVSSRVDVPTRRTSISKSRLASFLANLGQRFKLAANVMGFLANPEPSRVRRSLEEVVHRAVRSKRFTTAMNAWYDDLAGMNYDATSHDLRTNHNSLLSNLMLGLGRQFLGR